MTIRNIIGTIITIVLGVCLVWCGWASDSISKNRVAIAETRQELHSEMKSIKSMLDIHYGLLKEIRDNQ